MVSEQEDQIAKAIVDSSLTVLLESVYGLCLFHELSKRSMPVE
jgi:hypothetical protein